MAWIDCPSEYYGKPGTQNKTCIMVVGVAQVHVPDLRAVAWVPCIRLADQSGPAEHWQNSDEGLWGVLERMTYCLAQGG